jgi:hypothetical protein
MLMPTQKRDSIMGTMKKLAQEKHKASQASNATVNRAGGVAFEIQDPTLKLITMTGGSFFAEPRYYNGDDCISKRNSDGKFDKLAERLRIVDGKISGFASCEELDDVAKEIVATAMSIAGSENPEDLLIVGNWLRNDMYIRLTPQVLLVLASRIPETQGFVRKYATKIVKRPDEVKTCLLLHRFFFGPKSIKNCLGMGLSDAVAKFGEQGLMKYNSPDFPTWKDVLCWLPRKKNYPLSNELAKYFISGEIVDPSKTPVIAARKELAKCKVFDGHAKDLAAMSKVNWEVLISQFGNDAEQKKKAWIHLVNNNQVPYMALLRNIRNLIEAGVSDAVISKACKKLSNPDQVRKSKQLPFRFLMAHQMVSSMGYGSNQAAVKKFLEAIEDASNYACENIPDFPGTTAIFADNSGSMSQPVSGKSKMTCAGAANTLCGILAKSTNSAYVAAFGTAVGPVRYTKNDTVIGVADKVRNANTRGMATNAHLCIKWLEEQNAKFDRVIILSDMQCWNSGGSYYSDGNLADAWQNFAKKNPDCWLHSVHLNGYGDSPVDPRNPKVNLISGFSEKIFGMLLETEGASSSESQTERAKGLPTVDQIRENWKVE